MSGDEPRNGQHRTQAEELAHQRLRVIPSYEEGAIQWCTAHQGEAERGTDAYGDCAYCGEPVLWVVADRG